MMRHIGFLVASTIALAGCNPAAEPEAVGPPAQDMLQADPGAALLANLDKLNTREVLSAQDSLVAAFRAGEIDADTFLSGMRVFASHPDYDVAAGSTRLLRFIHDEFPELRDGLATHVRDTYRDRYRRIRGEDSVEGQLLAPTLGNVLATYGNDADAKNYLLRQGTLYLGLGVLEQDEEKRASVPSNILKSAFQEVMRRLPKPAFDPLVELASKGSPLEKSAALGALTATPDAVQAQRLLDMALAEDSPFTSHQSGTIMSGLIGNEAHSDRVWNWYKANFDAYMIRKVPDVRRGRAPLFARDFCSLEQRDEVRDFYTDKAFLIPGYEQSLAQTLESIELCAALKDGQGPSLRKALTR